MKDLKLSKKFTMAFGIILLLLTVISSWAIFGIREIVVDANQVIWGNMLRGEMVQRTVDHMDWAIELNALLTDENVTELTVQTDPTKCAFGKWYYSDASKQAEERLPMLKPILAAIEEPHNHLHTSAVKIGDVFKQADLSLSSFLLEKKIDHFNWLDKVDNIFIDPTLTKIDVITDHTKCSLGQWIFSENTEKMKAEDPQFAALWDDIIEPHKNLHESVIQINKLLAANRQNQAMSYYVDNVVPISAVTLEMLSNFVKWNDNKVESFQVANAIYTAETKTHLGKVKNLLNQIRQTAIDNVMTDEKMLMAADRTLQAIIIIGAIAILLGLFVAIMMSRSILNQLGEDPSVIKRITEKVATGDLDIKFEKKNIKGVYKSVSNMISELQYKAGMISRIADRDLTNDVKIASDQDLLGKSLVQMTVSLNEILGQVNTSVDQVNTGSDQVSQASQSLSQGATEQASSLEEISASIIQINSQSRQNAENATEANGLARQASSDAEKGNREMENLSDAMQKINTSSDQIKKIVKVIDDIAFQTNLLALNANVEAARAGKYGKGFAVVADEVRNLAVRSADAVKETTEMVDDSIRNIESGNKAVEATASQLESILSGSAKVGDFLEEISIASREQAEAIDQITQGLEQIDQVTQSNTASAEESAAAAEELASQSVQLKNMIATFKLKNTHNKTNSKARQIEYQIPEASQILYTERHTQETGIKQVDPVAVIALDDDDFDRF
jgi:methyl-accepting chemotaxis protein